MKVELVPIEKIIPYAENAKAHPEAQIKKLAAAIAEFGWDQPIVVDKDLVIIKGHARRLAAIFLGMQRVPVIVAERLTPAQVRGARLADNKMAEGEWYPDLLSWELQELAELGFDLDLTGFADFERAEIMGLQEKTSLNDSGGQKSRNLGKGQFRVKPVLAVEKVARYGNQALYADYQEICRELLEEKAARAGYRLGRWTAYYCGFRGQMTHYGAVLERT